MKKKLRPPQHCVSFSGHRSFKMNGCGTLFADDTPLGEKIRRAVRELAARGHKDFLCGMAEGFDLAAGEAVLTLKEELPDIRLIAVLPYPGHGGNFNTQAGQLHSRILEGADMTITVCESYSRECYHRRNDFLVEHGSVLLCLYNGAKGGTQYTVRRAAKAGLEIINLAV